MTPKHRASLLRSSEPSPMYGRRAAQPMAFSHAYDGASTDQYSARWSISETTPDAALAGALPALRARAADLVRNNPLAHGIVDTIRQGVIGRGPRWKSCVEGDLGETIEEFFSAWCETAGWDGVSSWADIGNGLVDGACISGDVLVIWPDVGDGTGPRVDLIDARRVDTPSDKTPECDTCRLGVGYDKFGRVLGYYVKASDEGSSLRSDFRWFPLSRGGRVNARLFRRPAPGRPRQSRSASILAPILHQLKEIPAYLLTENRRATQASKVHTIISTPDPKQIADAFENASVPGSDGSTIEDLMGRSYGNTPDGSMMVLGLGETAQIANPPSVNGGIGDYTEAQLRVIACATGFPFEEIFRLYAKLNYSNARTIRLMSKAAYRNWRDKVESGLCNPTIGLLVEYWWANGLLGAIPWNTELLGGQWHWDEMEWVDPAKETSANAEAMATGQKSIVDVCGSQGKDWKQILMDNLAQEKMEMDMRVALGLPPKGGAPASPGFGAPAPAPIPAAAPMDPETPDPNEDADV